MVVVLLCPVMKGLVMRIDYLYINTSLIIAFKGVSSFASKKVPHRKGGSTDGGHGSTEGAGDFMVVLELV